jgi:hypothetical protein
MYMYSTCCFILYDDDDNKSSPHYFYLEHLMDDRYIEGSPLDSSILMGHVGCEEVVRYCHLIAASVNDTHSLPLDF